MFKSEPIIGNYINPCDAMTTPQSSAKKALSLMKKRGIHYLPVLSDHQVIGLLSDRLRTFVGQKGKFTVSQLMLPKPSVVTPNTSLYQVLDETPESTAGCTVVQTKSGEIAGVFTPNDAIFAYRGLLKDKEWRRAVA